MPSILKGGLASQTMKYRSYRSGSFRTLGSLRWTIAMKTVLWLLGLQALSLLLQSISRREFVA